MKILRLLTLLLAFSLFFSCNEDEDEGFGMTMTPIENYLLREGGDVVSFTLSAQGENDLTRYRISEKIDQQASTLIKDEAISGRFFSDFFDYTVPDTFSFGNHEIELIFSTIDVRGNQLRRVKVINVVIEDKLLTEFGGNTMYSSLSTQFDAYDLLTGTPKNGTDTTAHIRDLSLPNPTDSLSRSWASPTDTILFVRFNSFDYGNATNESVKAAYNTGIKNDTIRNLQDEDVLLTRIGDRYLAVKVFFVTDQSGSENDRYIFSIKR